MRTSMFALLLTSALFAGNYITLDNGKVIELKPDGTWQEVKVVKKGNETIAIKPDGTWEKVQSKNIEVANKLETNAEAKFKDTPLAQTLIGKWSGDGERYEFTKDKVVFSVKDGHRTKTISGKWSVEKLDEKSKTLTLNLAEGARLGFLTFGGEIRKIKIIDDNTIEDITNWDEGKIVTLHRVR